MLYLVLMPWKRRSWFSADIKLINDNQSAVEQRIRNLLQTIVNHRLVLMNLSQRVC